MTTNIHPKNQILQSDFLGRTVATLTPSAAGGGLVTSNAYDGATSRLICTETTGQPATTYLYDALGNLVAQSGAAYPIRYGYDILTHMKGLAITRNANTFGYNIPSEVTNATLNAMDYTYAYDDIGNHTTSAVNSAATTYAANALNQYTSILCAPAPLREPSYDLDGNLLTNGVWAYTWDCENRLVAAYSNSVCVVSNAYDYMGRRVVKWTPSYTTTFVYDSWNLVQELKHTQTHTLTNHFVWGRDLSGALQGAGGVGGLLAISLSGTWYFPFYDNNGNITAYVDENGVTAAAYTYDAFGATLAQTGTMADAFPYRFSTKYHDPETGLYYYGYRFYSPALHRWLNRDPIEEDGGFNLYVFCDGNPIDLIDPYGLLSLPPWLRNLLPDWALSVDDVLGFGWSALRNNPEITLSEDVIKLVKNDPDMLRYDQEIMDALMAAVLQYRRPNTMAWRCIAFSLPPKRGTVTFCGNRAPQNMWEQLQGFWRSEYRATWRVGANPLTWMLRHANVRSQTEVNLCFNCLAFAGTYSTDYELSDTLDLRPHRHGNHDFELLLHPQDDPYDAATILLGTIWHDLFRRRDNVRVKAEWEKDMLFWGIW